MDLHNSTQNEFQWGVTDIMQLKSQRKAQNIRYELIRKWTCNQAGQNRSGLYSLYLAQRALDWRFLTASQSHSCLI